MCNSIRNFLRLVLVRCVLFPFLLLLTPLTLILFGDTCAEAWQEWKLQLKEMWRVDI